MKAPTQNSITSKKRKNRNFISLAQSCRIHKRAYRRSYNSRMQYGKLGAPGEKIDPGGSGHTHQCGGSIKFY